MNIIRWYKVCRKEGHHMIFDRPTLGGEYIRCKECKYLDEYLPGLHEPKGYDGIEKNSLGIRVKNPEIMRVKNSEIKMPKPKANITSSHWN